MTTPESNELALQLASRNGDKSFTSPTLDAIIPMPELVKLMGAHRDTLRRRADRGEFKLLRVGPRNWGMRVSEYERYLATAGERAAAKLR